MFHIIPVFLGKSSCDLCLLPNTSRQRYKKRIPAFVQQISLSVLLVFLILTIVILPGCRTGNERTVPGPIDPQVVLDQDDMTWDDYRPIPGINWADPSLQPERGFRIALVAVDFPDQPFVMTLPKHSDLFGNPQIDPVTREEIPRFYADFFLKPGKVNNGQTINGYWMEQSRGKFGITLLEPFGPYLMPRELWNYGLSEWGQNEFTPDGSVVNYRMERDVDSLWKADAGDIKGNYDAILRIYAGYDETGIWQEFGEMKFLTRDDIPAEWGNPNPEKPRWAATRYVPWTSWKAAQMQWGLSSMRQGENSGTITHELGHFAFRIGDNNNNPYVTPYRRAGSGPWDMMDRGCFNGPGGPHMRWVVPPIGGAAMPAGLMLRNRMVNGFLTEEDVLVVSRDGLAQSGLVVLNVAARAVMPAEGSYAGLIVRLDGEEPHDRTPPSDPATDPLSPGVPEYNFYSMEVVQRIGYDSFCPDNGVLLALNKDKEGRSGGPNSFNLFNWVIDANPQDINMVDFHRPDGTAVMRTIADYRQLNDALFHAGLNSGSRFEYVDKPNGLHFYIIDLRRDKDGILTYTLGVRSLMEQSGRKRAFTLEPPKTFSGKGKVEKLEFLLQNNDERYQFSGELHPSATIGNCLNSDIYRLSVEVEGSGYEAVILNELVAVTSGQSVIVPVYVTRSGKISERVAVRLTVVSESDPGVRHTIIQLLEI
jgi:M6 family metalloprotease-like protein